MLMFMREAESCSMFDVFFYFRDFDHWFLVYVY